MYKILVTTDGSEHSKRTIEETIKIAAPMGSEVEVFVVYVQEKLDDAIYGTLGMDEQFKEKVETTQKTVSAEAVARVEKQLADKGIKATTKILKGHPVEQICHYAEKEACNLIIMGKKKRGKIEEFMIGSVSMQVTHKAKTNVLVIK